MALYTDSGRRRILPPLVFGAGRALASAAPRPPLRRRAHVLVPLLLAARRGPRCARCGATGWWWTGSRCGAAPTGATTSAASAGAVGELVQRLCARVPQRAFCFSELHAGVCARRACAASHRAAGALRRARCEPHRAARGRAAGAVRRAADPREARHRSAVAAVALRRPAHRGPAGRVLRRRARARRRCAQRSSSTACRVDRLGAPASPRPSRSTRSMRRAMCMLLTSRREGYGMVVVEASAARHPERRGGRRGQRRHRAGRGGRQRHGRAARRPGGDRRRDRARARSRAGAAREHRRAGSPRTPSELSLESSLRKVLESYARRRLQRSPVARA